jgi:uncharacterized protein
LSRLKLCAKNRYFIQYDDSYMPGLFILLKGPENIFANINTMVGQLTRLESEAVLVENIFGHIGCNDGYNTYVYPSNYVYDGKYIYCHSIFGSKIQVMRRNKRVCFQVDIIKDFMNWKSVLVLGEYSEVEDARDRYYAMKAFLDHMLHLKISETLALPETAQQEQYLHVTESAKPVIYRISLDEITGRFEEG